MLNSDNRPVKPAAITAMAIVRGVAPATVGLDEIDPACAGVDHLRVTRSTPIRAALSNSFGFGGTNCCIVFRGV